MSKVFANGREIACQASDGKSVCCFPDVCFTPPQTPGTPPGVPIPYPNTGMASDTTEGSKTVKIGGKPVMLRNKSYFKKSTGDEAGSAPKKGVVTSKNCGKVYFTSWSMDVRIEGQNVVRHLDMTTHNHASVPGNTPPWPFLGKMAVSLDDNHPCKKTAMEEKQACRDLQETKTVKGKKKLDEQATRKRICEPSEEDKEQAEKCKQARKCRMVSQRVGQKSQCCPGDSAHHLVEAHCFYEVGKRGKPEFLIASVKQACEGKRKYVDTGAPCICASGPRYAKEHGQLHAFQGNVEQAHHNAKEGWTYAEARDTGVKAHLAVYPNCDPGCTRAQLDAYHQGRCGLEDNTPLRTDPKSASRSGARDADRLLDERQTKMMQEEMNKASRSIQADF